MISTFIIAAVTADGLIAENENHAAMWTSKEDKKRFVELTKRAGVVVMGSRTFRTLPRPLKERLNVVYTRGHAFDGQENVLVTQDEPRILLEKLEARGLKEVAICGGSQVYTAFMKARAVGKIFLTIEPIVFGKGMTLFNEAFPHTHLELISKEATETGTLLLEYKVNYHGNL
jgi:dihydrofolate reductase